MATVAFARTTGGVQRIHNTLHFIYRSASALGVSNLFCNLMERPVFENLTVGVYMWDTFASSNLSLIAIAAICAVYVFILNRRGAPALSRLYAPFPVVSRRVVNGGDRAVIFLVLKVSTAHLPTGAHVKVRATIGGEVVVRSYTPTRFNGGECELMVGGVPAAAAAASAAAYFDWFVRISAEF